MNNLDEDTTILLLCRDRPKYLEYALKSVLSQTYKEWKLIVSDNSSSEQIAKECNKVFCDTINTQNMDRKSIYIRQSGILRMCDHASKLINSAYTQYIAILNDDDIWMPNHLERCINFLKANPKFALTSSNSIDINEYGEETGSRTHNKDLNISICTKNHFKHWLSSWFGNFPSFVFLSAAVKDFYVIENQHIDTAIAISILLKGYKDHYFHEPSYYYRKHSTSATKTGPSMILERHKYRIWIGQNYFIEVSKLYNLFFLLYLKSVLYVLVNSLTRHIKNL